MRIFIESSCSNISAGKVNIAYSEKAEECFKYFNLNYNITTINGVKSIQWFISESYVKVENEIFKSIKSTIDFFSKFGCSYEITKNQINIKFN